MTPEDEEKLVERIQAMPEEERRALDPIAQALGEYFRREKPPVMPVPTRVIALACVDLARQWQELQLDWQS